MKFFTLKANTFVFYVFFGVMLASMFFFSSLPVYAQFDSYDQAVQSNTPVAGSNPQGSARITNPLGGITSVAQFIQLLLQAVVKIGVPIAVLFVVLAGFKFITAQGNPEQLATARRNFIHVVIGIAIFIGAWALAQLILETLRQIGVNV